MAKRRHRKNEDVGCLILLLFLFYSTVFSGLTSATEERTSNRVSDIPWSSEQEWNDILAQFNEVFDSMTDNLEFEETYLASRHLDLSSVFPTQEETLHATDSLEVDVTGRSIQTLNMPQYGNWTDESWSLRFRGYSFTQPALSNQTIEKHLSKLLGSSAWTLNEDQYLHAMQMARGLFILLRPNIQLSWKLSPQDGFETAIASGGRDRVWPPISREVIAPSVTDVAGDYDFFANISGLLDDYIIPGDSLDELQTVHLLSNATANSGIPMAYLVPPSGYTIVSDVDDVLRVSTIYHPAEGLRNLLTRPFRAWETMPKIFKQWEQTLPHVHFHYLTISPDQIAQSYMDFIYATYPHGSIDMRPYNYKRIRWTWSIRTGLLRRILETYPERKFILVGDNSNHDIMKNYPLLAAEYPEQIQCIFIRNVSATDRAFRWPYTTKYFKPLKRESYMLFHHPDDLTNLDIEGGQCNNESVPQHFDYQWQGLPWRP